MVTYAAGPALDGTPATWCGWCGEALAEGEHSTCLRQPELEPPRWCAYCRRRMVVQVVPGAWVARCSRHGSFEQPTWG